MLPGPPWTCRLQAVVVPARAGLRPRVLAVVDYADTPVGPYREALVAEPSGLLGVGVPWIVVDSEESAAAARAAWALPKQLAELDVDLDAGGTVVRAGVSAGAVRVALGARVLGPAVPFCARGTLRQPGRGPARLRVRGRARPALVGLGGDLPAGLAPGRRPGVHLSGTLVLGAPR